MTVPRHEEKGSWVRTHHWPVKPYLVELVTNEKREVKAQGVRIEPDGSLHFVNTLLYQPTEEEERERREYNAKAKGLKRYFSPPRERTVARFASGRWLAYFDMTPEKVLEGEFRTSQNGQLGSTGRQLT